MGGLRGRLRRLEATLQDETKAVVCPACGEEFRVHVDTGLHYLVWMWEQDYEGETYGETPPDVPRVVAHAHDPSLFVEKADNKPRELPKEKMRWGRWERVLPRHIPP